VPVPPYLKPVGVGATGTFNSPGSAPSGSITTTGASSLVWAVGNDGAHATTHKAATGQRIVNQDLTSTPSTSWVQSLIDPTPDIANGGTLATINDKTPTADPYNLVVIEIT
jgi:hypothetical protein